MWSMRLFSVVTLLSVLAVSCEGNRRDTNCDGDFDYPDARRNTSVVDNLHGHLVSDPYRWLEDKDSSETKAFIRNQNDLSQCYFNLCPFKNKIAEKLREKMNYDTYECPRHAGGKYYYFHNSGLQNQDVLYVQDTLNSKPSVFLDPNNMSDDGTVSLSYASAFSPDGSLYAYSLSIGGSDWLTIKVRNVSNRNDLPDRVNFVRYSLVAWTADNRGFFYSALNFKVSRSHSVFYHRVGTNQDEDVLAYHPEQSHWAVQASMSADNNYVVLYITDSGITNREYIVDVQTVLQGMTEPQNHTRLIDNFDNTYQYVTNVGQAFYYVTNKDAPFRKMVKINIGNPEPENWVDIVPENSEKGVLYEAMEVGHKLVLHYLNASKSQLSIHSLTSGEEEREVEVEMGSVRCLEGKRADKLMFFKFVSFLKPGSIYSLDVTTGVKTLLHQSTLKGFDADSFRIEQLIYKSNNDTKVPMFLVHKKNLELTGNHPVLLRGYGGFATPQRPFFSFDIIVFLQNMGGVYAFANIRGGLEYGEDWHKEGMLEHKQNVFDDFQAAAEFLINRNYTNSEKIAIIGRSNGGLLVGACLNQRPDLFAAGIAQMGVLDMLRYHKDTAGKYWIGEYGSPDNRDQFKTLYAYSPLHNIPSNLTEGQYPATLVMTAENDNRVVPMHSFKFTAELQHTVGSNEDQTNPLLLHVETNTGHGAGTPTSKLIAEKTYVYSFLCSTLDLQWSDE